MKMEWQNLRRLMSRERRSCNGLRRLICLAAASVLASGLIAPIAAGMAHAATNPDLDRKCSLRVKIAAMAMEEGGAEEAPDVAIDLYKVADAMETESGDGYSFRNLDVFSGLEFNVIVEEEADHAEDYEKIWKPLAQQAADRIFDSANPIEPAVKGGAANEALALQGATGLEAGLYLMVARGDGLEPEEYVVRGAKTGEDGISTIAYSDSYTFTYSPQLIALPARDSASGGWDYEYEMEPKFGLGERFAALAIEKTLESYLTGEDAAFVFLVEARMPDKDGTGNRVVYSDVVSLTFEGAGQQSVLLADKFTEEDAGRYTRLKKARIPAGAQVTVTEVYSGSVYRPSDGVTVWAVDALRNVRPGQAGFEESNLASFRNTYDGTGRHGSAITNHFEYIDDGEGMTWNWTQYPGAEATD